MRRFFNAENPVWRFIGNIADMFALSLLWYASLVLIVTAGAGTTAMYYCTLKLTSNQEGELFASFFSAFRQNLRQAVVMQLVFMAAGGVLAADLYWCAFSGLGFARALFPAAVVLCVLLVNWTSLAFPLLARLDNSVKSLLWISFTMSVRSFLPMLSASLLTIGLLALGVFVAWPALLIAPGFSAYINSYILNRVFVRAGISLKDE